ncbi:hypothetical protein AB6A40_008853 [Gnathostoma spinigerum]|uniref:Uncharacterized protein n=1 Tax=Gnathostoma spinigerum TaxID=75299 RepID=A0ABD6EY12_9BILA
MATPAVAEAVSDGVPQLIHSTSPSAESPTMNTAMDRDVEVSSPSTGLSSDSDADEDADIIDITNISATAMEKSIKDIIRLIPSETSDVIYKIVSFETTTNAPEETANPSEDFVMTPTVDVASESIPSSTDLPTVETGAVVETTTIGTAETTTKGTSSFSLILTVCFCVLHFLMNH